MRISDLVEDKDKPVLPCIICDNFKGFPFQRGGFNGNTLMGCAIWQASIQIPRRYEFWYGGAFWEVETFLGRFGEQYLVNCTLWVG